MSVCLLMFGIWVFKKEFRLYKKEKKWNKKDVVKSIIYNVGLPLLSLVFANISKIIQLQRVPKCNSCAYTLKTLQY